MSTNDKLDNIKQSELKLSHVEGHRGRLSFISDVIKYYGKYRDFDELVDWQLDLFCDEYIDPRTFVRTCNDPAHRIRNAMIRWNIDHAK